MEANGKPNVSSAAAVLAIALAAPIVLHAAFVVVSGLGSFVVVCPSIEPAIPAGSIVYVVGADAYVEGDAVTFTAGNRIVTHRIVGRTADGYVTQGDANGRPDGVVAETDLIGRVDRSVAVYGHLLRVVTSPLGYVLFVLAPKILLIGYELRKIQLAVRDRRRSSALRSPDTRTSSRGVSNRSARAYS